MAARRFDVAVVGTGPGGYVAAIRCAQLGLTVAAVEDDRPGGVCLNWGCIPTKALLKSAEVLEYAHRAKEFGIVIEGARADFPAIIKRSRDVSDPMGSFTGDYVDLSLGYLEVRPSPAFAFSAGKFDSVVGREYRFLESDLRTTVTPSLLCRYVCGHPIGVKGRFVLPDDRLTASVAVTNGSHFQETFPFSDETDSNHLQEVYAQTSKSWQEELLPTDEHLGRHGRGVEVLSGHRCEGWLEVHPLRTTHFAGCRWVRSSAAMTG